MGTNLLTGRKRQKEVPVYRWEMQMVLTQKKRIQKALIRFCGWDRWKRMKQLYEDVLLKKSELLTAQIAFQKAQGQKQNADVKYNAGLLNQEEYLTEEMNYISQTASYKAADLAFTQAADTYGWAVMGITQ